MTIIQELEQAKTELAAKAASLATAEADIKAGAELIAQADKARLEIKASMDAMTSAHAEALKVETAKFDVEKAAHVATKAELEAAKKTLANPAFGAALAKGDKVSVPEGGSESQASAEVMTYAQAQAAYAKIEGAKEKAEFRAKYKKELGL